MEIGGIRIQRLRSGNWQFGHAGMHRGIGTKDCPRKLHHHCDDFCKEPSIDELIYAGINPDNFKVVSRR